MMSTYAVQAADTVTSTTMMITIAPIEQDRAVQAALGPISTKVDCGGTMIASGANSEPRKRPPPLMIRRSDGTGP
jgi:hypothetical protein